MDSAPAAAMNRPIKCNVCLDGVVDCYVVPCGHYFHGKCLQKWLSTRQECPLCHRRIQSLVADDRLSGMKQEDKYASKLPDTAGKHIAPGMKEVPGLPSTSNDQRKRKAESTKRGSKNSGGPEEDNKKVKKKHSQMPLRRGKWTQEEEDYANRLIKEFKAGLLPLDDGTTLRNFLSKLLNCDPMRISKKFVGNSCIGKQVFRKKHSQLDKMSMEELEKSRQEIAELERRFLAKVYESSNSRKKGSNGAAAFNDVASSSQRLNAMAKGKPNSVGTRGIPMPTSGLGSRDLVSGLNGGVTAMAAMGANPSYVPSNSLEMQNNLSGHSLQNFAMRRDLSFPGGDTGGLGLNSLLGAVGSMHSTSNGFPATSTSQQLGHSPLKPLDAINRNESTESFQALVSTASMENLMNAGLSLPLDDHQPSLKSSSSSMVASSSFTDLAGGVFAPTRVLSSGDLNTLGNPGSVGNLGNSPSLSNFLQSSLFQPGSNQLQSQRPGPNPAYRHLNDPFSNPASHHLLGPSAAISSVKNLPLDSTANAQAAVEAAIQNYSAKQNEVHGVPRSESLMGLSGTSSMHNANSNRPQHLNGLVQSQVYGNQFHGMAGLPALYSASFSQDTTKRINQTSSSSGITEAVDTNSASSNPAANAHPTAPLTSTGTVAIPQGKPPNQKPPAVRAEAENAGAVRAAIAQDRKEPSK